MENSVSRRDFVAAAAGAAAAGAALTAGVARADEAASSDKPWLPASWDYETDVLVIGYGGAGQWAGLIAYDEGAEVMFLEKSPSFAA